MQAAESSPGTGGVRDLAQAGRAQHMLRSESTADTCGLGTKRKFLLDLRISQGSVLTLQSKASRRTSYPNDTDKAVVALNFQWRPSMGRPESSQALAQWHAEERGQKEVPFPYAQKFCAAMLGLLSVQCC